MSVSGHAPHATIRVYPSTITLLIRAALEKSNSVTSRSLCCATCGKFPSQEQSTWIGNSRWSSVCLLARIVWNNRSQTETPARRNSRVISERRLAFFQPIAVFAAARYWGAATTSTLMPPEDQTTTEHAEHTETSPPPSLVSIPCIPCRPWLKNTVATQPQDVPPQPGWPSSSACQRPREAQTR